MKGPAAILGRVRRREGQVLPLMAVSIVVLIGMAAIVFDIGRVYVAQEQLQAAVNSAALVAGQDLPNATTAYNAAVSYSGAPGKKNALGGYEAAAGSPNVTFECLPDAPEYNSGSCPADASSPATYCPTGCNAVNVTEKAAVQTTLGGVLNLPSFTVSASATASQRGATPHPANVYVILDNTRSMGYSNPTTADPTGGYCAATVPGITPSSTEQEPDKLDCAKAGALALLNTLDPCNPSLPSCPTTMTPNSAATPATTLGANMTPSSSVYDEVGLLVIPAMIPSKGPLADEIDCRSDDDLTSSDDEYPPWSDPTSPSLLTSDAYLGYQAVGLSSDYRTADVSTATTAATWTTSNAVEALDWGECSPKSYPAGSGTNPNTYGLKDIGGVGSYLAGAISDAQYELQQNARPGATNIIVIESDGELNPSTTFSGDKTPDTTACGDAYNAAAEAKAAGDTIYTIEYDSDGVCGPDSGPDSVGTFNGAGGADLLMTDMASSTSDAAEVSGAGDLTAPFKAVGDSIGGDSTLIP
jgi:hypothetical protein